MPTTLKKQILFCLSHPRSLSTAFYRAMIERPDVNVLYEPFTIQFWVSRIGYIGFESDDRPDCCEMKTPSCVAQYVEKKALNKRLFLKDSAMATRQYLLAKHSDAFIQKTAFTFLLRHPAKVIASFYRQYNDAHVTTIAADYTNLLSIFNRIEIVTGNKPLLIDTDDLQRSPEKIMQAYCDYNQLPFSGSSLHWKSNHMDDRLRVCQSWHANTVASAGFKPLQDNHIEKALDEIKKTPVSKQLLSLYERQLPVYETLLSRKIITV